MKRFQIFNSDFHGGDLIGEADTVAEAVKIGRTKGCTQKHCKCGKYGIKDTENDNSYVQIVDGDTTRYAAVINFVGVVEEFN